MEGGIRTPEPEGADLQSAAFSLFATLPKYNKWRETESNRRHMELQSIALPTELPSQTVWTGLEPATSCVTGRHSNQLNYQTIFSFLFGDFEKSKSIAGAGFEPTTFGL